MPEEHKTVFISYRRSAAGFIARAIFLDLRSNDYDVFMDVETMDSGQFEQIIFNQIEARAHFLVILTPGTVERYADPDDLMRREIEYAMEKQRNIVPLLANNFSFTDAQPYLTGKLATLPGFNGVTVPLEYFEEAMQRLRTRFLKQPVYGALKLAPPSDQPVVQEAIDEAAAKPPPTTEQLTAEEHFNRALTKLESRDFDSAINDFGEAIRLNPQSDDYYHYRALIRQTNDDLDGAIADFDEAIRLNPQSALFYCNRGYALYLKEDFKGAIADLTQAIHADSAYAYAYPIRGYAYFFCKEFEKALSDFQRANSLQPLSHWTLGGLAITYHSLGQKVDAKHLWRALMAQDRRFKDADWVGKELNWREPLVEAARKLITEL